MGRREKWLFPKFCDGINQNTIRLREHTGHAMAKGWSTQLGASSSHDKNKCAMSKTLHGEFPDIVQNVFKLMSLTKQLHYFKKPY